MSQKARAVGAALFLVVLTGLILLVVRPKLDPVKIPSLELILGAWVAFAAAAWLLRRVAVKLAVGLILVGAIAVQAAALSAPPAISSDLYRYMWDGRVQAAGIDPYLYPPGAAQVAGLRNDFLWSGTGAGHYVDCVKLNSGPDAASLVPGCTKLNRPQWPTVYPPVAEAYFYVVQVAAPADNSTTPIQAAAAVCALLTTLILLYGLRALGRDPRWAALWAWCPTIALEAGNNAHADVLAALITALALLALARARTRRRTILGGALLGLAIATKFTPVLVVPAVLRRRWVLVCSAAATAIALVYLPHVVAVGTKAIGFLPEYFKQQGYTSGTGFGIIELVVHGKAASVAAVAIMAVIALAILRFGDPDRPWRGGLLMTAAMLTVFTPDYEWYSVLLVLLVALDGSPEWLAIAAGGYLPAYTLHPRIFGITITRATATGYGAGALIACSLALARYLRDRRRAAALPVTAPETVLAATAAGEPAGPETPVEPAAEAADAAQAPASQEAGAASGPVIEPTAVFHRNRVSVSIGTDGAPSFMTDDEQD